MADSSKNSIVQSSPPSSANPASPDTHDADAATSAAPAPNTATTTTTEATTTTDALTRDASPGNFLDPAAMDETAGLNETVSEDAVRQHLKDFESSFLPAVSPIPTRPSNGEPAADDTFLFDSPQKVDPSAVSTHDKGAADNAAAGNTTSYLEAFDSSPTAAAAARTLSRAVSMASNVTRQEEPGTQDEHGAVDDESFALSPDPDDRCFQAQPHRRLESENTAGFPPLTKRSRNLRNAFGSQRSSISSFITNAESFDDGDSILNAGIDDFADTSQQLEPLPKVLSPIRSKTKPPLDPLKTPKSSGDKLNAAPTDTVIALHVKNVHVPESLAKEYKFRSGLETPRRFVSNNAAGTGTVSRTEKNLTLKEQSSTIEKLSKENFDLKLKVMFLSDRLDKLSEEGIKEMISENVQLKTTLAVLQRDNRVLRKRVKELEKRVSDDEERPSTGRSSSTEPTSRINDQEYWEREQELIFLRERVEEYAVEIETLRSERVSKESEKRKLADIVKNLSERTGDQIDRQEEADVWRDLLEQETVHREQTEEDNVKLRDEVFKLKKEMEAMQNGHTTNIYNISKRQKDLPPGQPADVDSSNAGFSAASTLVDELRRESEKLRHENAELRREVGAQTSMLTSRNREKDRLQQEIEDLKISNGRGGSASAADSILDRSASRAGLPREYSPSLTSDRTRRTANDDAEREDLEDRLAEARDRLSESKMHNQELERELDACMRDFEEASHRKNQAENAVVSLQGELDVVANNLLTLKHDHNVLIDLHNDLVMDCDALQKNNDTEAHLFEELLEKARKETELLQADLTDRNENFVALQNAMREMSESLVGLEDDQNKKVRRIQQLEAEIESSNRELEAYEAKMSEESEKNRRFSVQQESSQTEIAFLREEQEADKIRIGDLEAAVASAEQNLRDEKDRARELDERLQQERAQRELVADQEKEEVQQFVNELNREASAAKDEVRKLRKSLSSREVEATAWKERLQELENNLRVTLGDLNGTRSSLLGSIARIQRDLENTVRELDVAKASVVEKDRLIKKRDALLESQGLESRKANELLEKEKSAHRHTKSEFETFQRTHQHLSRTATTQDSRIAELESTRGQERRKLAMLEQSAREQLLERNELLLLLWKRLSLLCGREWSNSHTLVDKQVVPTVEVVSSRLPGFTKNLLAAVKMIESMLRSFETKISSVERDLTREYQALESNLDTRIKKLDRLDALVRSQIATGAMGSLSSQELKHRLTRVEHSYQKLKIEYETLKTATNVRARAVVVGGHGGGDARSGSGGGSPSPGVPRGPGERDKERTGSLTSLRDGRVPSASRHRSPSMTTSSEAFLGLGLMEVGQGQGSQGSQGEVAGGSGGGGQSYKDTPLMLRLRNLESKLRAERESRDQERDAARQRLSVLEEENKGLRSKIQRKQMAE